MTTSVPLLTREQVERLPERARAVVEYRKSGLSLNHIQGCPLDCAYCIRHTYGLWDQRQPRALTSDAEAVEQLVGVEQARKHRGVGALTQFVGTAKVFRRVVQEGASGRAVAPGGAARGGCRGLPGCGPYVKAAGCRIRAGTAAGRACPQMAGARRAGRRASAPPLRGTPAMAAALPPRAAGSARTIAGCPRNAPGRTRRGSAGPAHPPAADPRDGGVPGRGPVRVRAGLRPSGDARPLPGNAGRGLQHRGLTRAGGRTAQADEALSARDRHQPAGTWLAPRRSRCPSRDPPRD